MRRIRNENTVFLNPFPDLAHRKSLNFQMIANNKSFVYNRNRGSTVRQSHTYAEGMKLYGIYVDAYDTIKEYCTIHTPTYSKKVLDIGFGNGESLMTMAREEKDTMFFGIDVYKPGITSMCTRLFASDIHNIRIIHDDAVPVLFYKVEDNSIDRIQLLFPDPWPKRKHHKRRLIQKRFLQLCLSLLKPNGILWIVTDWEEYAHSIYHTMQSCRNEHMQCMDSTSVSFLHDATLLESLENRRTHTAFERKGRSKGHAIFPFVYRKHVESE